MVSRLLATKLGRCPRCIRASAWGTLGAWTTVAVVSILWPLPLLVGLSFLVALSFTALLGAHLVVFTARLAALHDGHAASPRAEVGLGRRVFLLRVGWGAFWAAALGVGLFRMPPAAAAQ